MIINFYSLVDLFGLDTKLATYTEKKQFIDYISNNDGLLDDSKYEYKTKSKITDNYILTFESIGWIITYAIDMFDLLKRDKLNNKSNQTYILDMEFMNDYELKPGYETLGVIGTFKLDTDGFVLESVKDGEHTYTKDKYNLASCKIALYKLYSAILIYSIVCSHLIGTHLYSAKITDLNEKYLDLENPLRKILIPTELSTKETMAKSLILLISKEGILVNALPYTFEGLKNMITEYLNKHSSLTAYIQNKIYMNISEEERESISKALAESLKEAKENKQQLFYIFEKKEYK